MGIASKLKLKKASLENKLKAKKSEKANKKVVKAESSRESSGTRTKPNLKDKLRARKSERDEKEPERKRESSRRRTRPNLKDKLRARKSERAEKKVVRRDYRAEREAKREPSTKEKLRTRANPKRSTVESFPELARPNVMPLTIFERQEILRGQKCPPGVCGKVENIRLPPMSYYGNSTHRLLKCDSYKEVYCVQMRSRDDDYY